MLVPKMDGISVSHSTCWLGDTVFKCQILARQRFIYKLHYVVRPVVTIVLERILKNECAEHLHIESQVQAGLLPLFFEVIHLRVDGAQEVTLCCGEVWTLLLAG